MPTRSAACLVSRAVLLPNGLSSSVYRASLTSTFYCRCATFSRGFRVPPFLALLSSLRLGPSAVWFFLSRSSCAVCSRVLRLVTLARLHVCPCYQPCLGSCSRSKICVCTPVGRPPSRRVCRSGSACLRISLSVLLLASPASSALLRVFSLRSFVFSYSSCLLSRYRAGFARCVVSSSRFSSCFDSSSVWCLPSLASAPSSSLSFVTVVPVCSVCSCWSVLPLAPWSPLICSVCPPRFRGLSSLWVSY